MRHKSQFRAQQLQPGSAACAAGSRAWSRNWESPEPKWINSLHLIFFFFYHSSWITRILQQEGNICIPALSWNHFLGTDLNTEAGTVQEFQVEKGEIQPDHNIFTLSIQARETNAGSAHTHTKLLLNYWHIY